MRGLARGWILGAAISLHGASVHAATELAWAKADEIDGEHSTATLISWTGHEREFRGWRWQPEVLAGVIQGRPEAEVRARHDVHFAGYGTRVLLGDFYIGSGLILIDQQSSILSSVGQFVSSVGWSRGPWRITLRHLSNANTHGENRGENLLSIGYAW